jgi:calcineurin-like phosphoesterase family protein
MLNDNENGIALLKQLKGKIHIILGNHDTKKSIPLYEGCENVVEITYAKHLKYKGYHFILTHYPTYTANITKESIYQAVINLHGNTHQKDPFFQGLWFMYNVSVDAHDCKPIALPQIIREITEKLLATEDINDN